MLLLFLLALPVFAGLALWFTVWAERKVIGSAPPAVRGPDGLADSGRTT